MRKNIAMSVIGVCLALASALYLNAMTSRTLRVNVPFAFRVDTTALPAGTYIVEIERTAAASPLGSSVLVRTLDGKLQSRFATMPCDHGAKPGARLTFNRYGSVYFLSLVESQERGCRLFKSKAEVELAGRVRSSQRASVAAE